MQISNFILKNMDKKDLLQKFLFELLPPTGNKRNYPSNEFMDIFKSINSIFSHYFGLKFQPEELEKILCKVYQRWERNMTAVPDLYVPSFERFFIAQPGDQIKNPTRRIGGKVLYEGPNLYFDIPPKDLNYIRKSTRKMPPTTKPEVHRIMEVARRKVMLFKESLE